MLSTVLAGVLLYLSVRGVDWGSVVRIIAGAHWPYVIAAVGTIAFSLFWRAMRWRILLNAETRFPVATVFWATSVGYLGNNFLPARAGEVIRSLLISRRSSLSRTYVFTTAIGERMMDVIALVLFSSLALLTLDRKPGWMKDLSGTMAVSAAIGAILVVILPHTGGLLEKVLLRLPLPAGLRKFLLRLTEQVLLGLRAFHDWGRFARFVVLTVVIWLSDSLGTILGARALGLTIPFPVAVLLLTGLGLGSALPSTPGYVGIYQFVAVTVLTPFGISRDAALAYILVYQAMGYLVIVGFGLPALYQLQARPGGGEAALEKDAGAP